MLSFEYSEIFKSHKFDTETLEKEIYAFFFNEWSHTVFTRKIKRYTEILLQQMEYDTV